MKERPILFSGQMVPPLLNDTKTQTRRAWREQPPAGVRVAYVPGHTRTPYGQPGDHLWVKETFFAWGRWETHFSEKKGRDEWHFVDMTLECGHQYAYSADGFNYTSPRRRSGIQPTWWKRPAIFMPRDVSRVTLEVTEIRVDRLKNISKEDAIAEGMDPRWYPRAAFIDLWESINGAGSWAANPWVWAVSFRRITT